VIYVTVTEVLLYFCFALLGGTLTFYSLDEEKRPDVRMKKQWLLYATLAAGVLSFAPILYTIIMLGQDMGYWQALTGVLFTFQIGKAWMVTLVLVILLAGLIYFNDLERDHILSRLGLILFIGILMTYAKAGHAASLSPTWGFTAHFFHLLAVSLWTGGLITAAWFSQSTEHWPNFLRWFTPFSIVCILAALASGFGTMMIDIAKPLDHSLSATAYQYKQGLIMNYGEALIIKHLLLIPLILYAAFNGFYAKHRLRFAKRSPYAFIKWARVESIILFFIFAATAFMGQQKPPHDVAQSILSGETSPLFTALYSGTVKSDTVLHFSMTFMTAIFFLIAVLFLVMTAIVIMKKRSAFIAVVCSVGYLISSYLGVMSGLH